MQETMGQMDIAFPNLGILHTDDFILAKNS